MKFITAINGPSFQNRSMVAGKCQVEQKSAENLQFYLNLYKQATSLQVYFKIFYSLFHVITQITQNKIIYMDLVSSTRNYRNITELTATFKIIHDNEQLLVNVHEILHDEVFF